jgi:hypothetical protein
VQTRFPDLKVADIQKLISYKWSKMELGDKEEWVARAKSPAATKVKQKPVLYQGMLELSVYCSCILMGDTSLVRV